MVCGMQPASMSYIPREGEYDVICHHCSSSVDSQHQSVSERNGDSQASSNEKKTSCPEVLLSAVSGSVMLENDHHIDTKVPRELPPPAIPLVSTIQNPLMGLKMMEIVAKSSHTRSSSLGFQKPLKLSDSSPSSSEESLPVKERRKSPRASYDRPDTPPTSVEENDESPTHNGSSDAKTKKKRDLMRSLFDEEKCTGKRPDSPYPFGYSDGSPTSIASTISLTQAVELLKARNEGAAKPWKGPFKAKNTWKSSPCTSPKRKAHRVRSKGRRKVRFEHRELEKQDSAPKPDENSDRPESSKPEVVNSATKRRDRRERAIQKKREGRQPASQYWHMRISNHDSNAPHR